MRFIDEKGRVLGLLNAIDLAVALTVCAVAALGYHTLARHYRITAPHPLPESAVWVRAELRIPPDRSFLKDSIAPGSRQLDPRDGAPVAEVLACTGSADGGLAVTVRLRAARDTAGHFFYGTRRLVPGSTVSVETDACIVEGIVASPPVVDPGP